MNTVVEEGGTTMTQHLTMSLQAVGQGTSGGDSAVTMGSTQL